MLQYYIRYLKVYSVCYTYTYIPPHNNRLFQNNAIYKG